MSEKRIVRNGLHSREVAVGMIPVNRKAVHRCPACNTIGCTGDFGPGSNIEIQCRRCKDFFRIAQH